MGPSPHLWFLHTKSVLWSRITSLYGSQTSPVVFGCKTATFGPEWQVSMGPTHDLWFCACTTTCLASVLLVSTAPSPHLWFLHAKQRLLDPNNKSLRVPDITCHFVHAIQRDLHQNYFSLCVPTLIFGFCMQNSDFRTRTTSL